MSKTKEQNSDTPGKLTHFDEQGNAVMVDVGSKNETRRIAVAKASITMSKEAYNLVKSGKMSKGDVLGISRVAGIMACKKVDELIPLTHPLMIDKANIEFEMIDQRCCIDIYGTVGMHGKTGVEMEALTAVSIAALTIYDMCKAVDKSMVIEQILLEKKSGGKSGDYVRT